MIRTDGKADKECKFHLTTSDDEAKGNAKKMRSVVPFRTKLEKLLAVAVVVLLVVCVVVIALLAVEKRKDTNSTPKTATRDELDDCAHSDEAKRSGFVDFMEKVQDTYYKYNRDSLARLPGMTNKEYVDDIRARYLPFNATPEYLKKRTDVALSLYKEISEKVIHENKLKPREAKALQQVKLYLKTAFGSPFDQNFYDGDWLLGPNQFCWQSVCWLGFVLHRYSLAKPSSLAELEESLRRLRLHSESLRQYKSNLKLGVKVGMVRSVFVCKAGLNSLKLVYGKISKNNNPKDVLNERLASHYRNATFIKGISDSDRQQWLALKGKNISESIDDALIEGIGEPLVELINYLEKEHVRFCLPKDLSSGFAGIPVNFIYHDGNRTENRTTKKLPLTGQKLSGKDSYKNILPYFTTSDITPDEIYQIGKERLEVLYLQALAVARNVTGQSDNDTAVHEFRKLLNSSEQFFNSEPFPANESDPAAHKSCTDEDSAKTHCPKRWAAMQKWSKYCLQTMGMLSPKLIPLFRHTGKKITVPNCPIRMVADFNPSSAAQTFTAAGLPCDKPAKYSLPFFLNNYGPKYAEWSVTAHESWPGHHTQVQGNYEYFQDKCKDVLSWLDEETSYTFFTEGWALYAENPLIAQDTDVYEGKPMQRYGMLQWQIWRALRLVIDTGLHYRGMNRSTALALISKYGWDESDLAQKEVTRYQGFPGQATSYLLGQRKLLQLRRYCQTELRDKFDIKEFHYQVLSQGSAPASYLEQHVKKFVNCTLGDLGDDVCDPILDPPKEVWKTETNLIETELGREPRPWPYHVV